ncbi:hypothetical protein HBN50_04020 [Halobacteriovorax sp. GB3]|uniref:hypothetical protein n=1 Tax=Halobacteriovorax sp. GB3 TaxID=2719615 RepID=UPI00235DCB2D|nr:hypothetical protein [Halobacteriovorax sp. GB3]MDD0852247.1 hypothetical protein [Halobacteriovorax sp. GB3]
MSLAIREVDLFNNKKELKAFVDIPWTIYKNDPNWVAPLKMAVKELFTKKHPFYQTGSLKSWIVSKNGKDVGRICSIVNDAHNKYHEENVGFFGFIEAPNDNEIWDLLIETAEKDLKSQGLLEMRGPLNPSTNYEGATLIDGFDGPPVLMMSYNKEYYQEQLERRGYGKSKDLLAYIYDLDSELPEVIHKIADRAVAKNKITFRTLDKKNWAREVDLMFDLYNKAWEKNWGFVPMTRAEFDHMAKDLKMLVKEDLIMFTEVDGKAAGFLVGLPDLFQALHKNPSGKLFPTGIFKLLFSDRYITRVRVLLMGVLPEYRRYGLETLLYRETKRNLNQNYPQVKQVEMSWILEDNLPMNKPLQRMGAVPYRTYRIFGKEL